MTTKNYIIPYVIEKTDNGERSYDIYSRILNDRIIILGEEVTNENANAIVAELLYLDSMDNTKPISLYINSPGGSISSGLAIIDTMNQIKSPVYTFSIGLSASMGAAILSCGEKGHRYSFPNSQILVHQASAGTEGNIQDMRVAVASTEAMNNRMAEIISKNCGITKEEYFKATVRDHNMFPEEALKFGIIDEIINPNKKTK